MTNTFEFKTIAIAKTPFNEKFAIPRQAGLINLPATLELQAPYNRAEAVQGLQDVSHIWVQFIFHQHLNREAALTVRPPRLGGNKKLGVFATRSSYRPNPIGQSVVKLERIEVSDDGISLHILGADLLDGTPIIDIKPYLPYADIYPEAVNNIAAQAPDQHSLTIQWEEIALSQLQKLKPHEFGQIQQWVTELLQLDPRPAYKSLEAKSEYGMLVFDLNVCWRMISENEAIIYKAEKKD